MGHFWKSLLIFSLVLSCAADPQAELNRRIPSSYVFQGDRLLPLGGWAQLGALSPSRLTEPVIVPWGDTFFLETQSGLGSLSVRQEVLHFEPFQPTIRMLKKTWRWDHLYIFAQTDKPGLFRWTPFGAPEPVLIPTHLAEPEKARLARVEWVEGEWLFQWAAPLNRWTLFNARVGLERQLTATEAARLLEQAAARAASELPEDYRPFLPGGYTVLVHDEKLALWPTSYRQGNGPTHYALRYRNAVWVTDPSGWVRGSEGEARIPLGSGVKISGLASLPSGLVAVWQKPVAEGRGHWGLIHLPWQFLKNRGIVER